MEQGFLSKETTRRQGLDLNLPLIEVHVVVSHLFCSTLICVVLVDFDPLNPNIKIQSLICYPYHL